MEILIFIISPCYVIHSWIEEVMYKATQRDCIINGYEFVIVI